MRSTIAAALAAAAVVVVGTTVLGATPQRLGAPAPADDLESATRLPMQGSRPLVYVNDFSNASDAHRLDEFVAYRDPFVVNHTTGASDHASTGGSNCTAPEQTRPQTRDNPAAQPTVTMAM